LEVGYWTFGFLVLPFSSKHLDIGYSLLVVGYSKGDKNKLFQPEKVTTLNQDMT